LKRKNPNALKQIIKKLESCDSKVVAVGFPAGHFGSYPNGESVAQVAGWNVYGTATIPKRDFMGMAEGPIKQSTSAVFSAIDSGKLNESAVTSLLNAAGNVAVSEIKKAIVDLDDPPNAESKIAKKGFNNPLIETGLMLQSVTYVIRDRKK